MDTKLVELARQRGANEYFMEFFPMCVDVIDFVLLDEAVEGGFY